MSILQYLSEYAEPECSCKPPAKRYANVIVMPAFDEVPSMLEGLRRALGERSLCIAVVNCRADHSEAEQERTHYLVRALAQGGESLSTSGISLSPTPGHGDLVIVDRASPGRELPAKQGVGLARKIGFDLALSWQQQGVIESPWIHTTDADVRLPTNYFEAAAALADDSETVALAYSFWHQIETASTFGRALELYEMSLRYYVLGLAWAGSPYAFHCVGSTMAVRGQAYHQVRGVPKREAGEDFYLLNKLAKLGRVAVPDSRPIIIAQRPSARTPFGTGPAMRSIEHRIREGEGFRVYNPTSFALLREWLDSMEAFAESCDIGILERFSHAELAKALPLDTEKHLRETARQCKSPEARRRRLHTWFDGFRTLKLVHALRERGLEDKPYQEAFDSAPFVPEKREGLDLRQTMARREVEVRARATPRLRPR